MNRKDALLSVERYATSKLRSAEDIWHIQTMGFRGEALSSIAAVSSFTLLTAQKQQDEENTLLEGVSLNISGGSVPSVQATNMLAGTIIEVKELFFNVPARRKFQKTPQSQTNEIIHLLTALSLIHPDIAFELVCNHKKVFSLKRYTENALFSRMKEVLGQVYADKMVSVGSKEGKIQISGYVSRPEHTWPNKKSQYLFVNKRLVQSKELSQAVKNGYATMLEKARFPGCVLYIDVPQDLVDVNVHPQKQHVRFSLEEKIESICAKAAILCTWSVSY